jgi:pimeloyl-ACP methyl ester carboxylesterase
MNRFTVSVLAVCLLSALTGTPAFAGESVDLGGEVDGVPFHIRIPENWNNSLVMYTHGYLSPGAEWKPLHPLYADVFLQRGFAIAESAYSRQGWAVEQALAETEALRRYFSELHGRPDTTFVFGFSMGGLITLATIERYPYAYDGALPMCGPLLPSLVFFKERVFDPLVTFEALFGESIPPENRPLVLSAALAPEAVEAALSSDSTLAEAFSAHWGIRRADLPTILSMDLMLYRELVERAGGNPIDNRNTIYTGFESVPGLNEMVGRYAADEGAEEYLRTYYTPTARAADPVLALHTTYDPGVPPSLPGYYDWMSTLAGKGGNFVQKYVQADGHCRFAPDQVGSAFDELRAWAATGRGPKAGSISSLR